jgi:hypothetical protein
VSGSLGSDGVRGKVLAYNDGNPGHHWEYLGELLMDGALVRISSREGFDVGHVGRVLRVIERGM